MSANERQVAGDHYKRLKPEPWDVMLGWDEEHFIGFLRYSALKRLARWDSKDGALQDVKKAIHELEKLTEVMEARDARKLAEVEQIKAALQERAAAQQDPRVEGPGPVIYQPREGLRYA